MTNRLAKKERDTAISDALAALASSDIDRDEAIENLEELIDRAESLVIAMREDEEREARDA